MIAATFIIGYNIYQSRKQVSLSALNLANIEALANDESWIEEWWDSKTYACQSVQTWVYKCMPYKDVSREDGDWEINIGHQPQPDEIVCGMFKEWDTDCVSGNEVAHCWDCE